MTAKIEKGVAKGKISAPSSKSVSHRALIAAALCDGVSRIENLSECDDVLATIDVLRLLGADIRKTCNNTYTVRGIDFERCSPAGELFCRESGSTLRFMIPIAAMLGKRTFFSGAPSLLRRPLTVFEKLFSEKSVEFNKYNEKISVCGKLLGGEYNVEANISSQFITGLIFALSKAEGDSKITLTSEPESKPYIDLTISVLSEFGVKVFFKDEKTIIIPGSQKYTPKNITVEADFSGAAFPAAFNFLGGYVEISGLVNNSLQADSVFSEHFEAITNGSPTIDISDCPDLAPILFALAAAKNGATFLGTKRLKIKESDRAQAMADELSKIGASVTVYENSVKVEKANITTPKTPIDSHNDHRIVMAMAILLTLVGGEISGAEAICKSYPEFFSDLMRVGIGVTLYE